MSRSRNHLDTVDALGYGLHLFGFAVPAAAGTLLLAWSILVFAEARPYGVATSHEAVALPLFVASVGWLLLLAALGGAAYKLRADARVD